MVSVVIPTRDRVESLHRCLRAVAAQQTAREFEVVIVDDGSAPPVDIAGLELGVPARVLRAGGNGPARARNAGAAAARGHVLLFTDDDTEPAPTWLDAACADLDAHPDEVGVEGPVASPPYDPLYAHSLESTGPGAYWTCNMAFRRSVFEDLGGFYEGFPYPHCEDLDIAYRALRVGPIGFADGMRITHHPRELSAWQYVRRGRLAASEVMLFARHRERYGRVRRMPAGLFPLISAVDGWVRMARREGLGLLRSPRRAARYIIVAGGYVAAVALSLARTAGRQNRLT